MLFLFTSEIWVMYGCRYVNVIIQGLRNEKYQFYPVVPLFSFLSFISVYYLCPQWFLFFAPKRQLLVLPVWPVFVCLTLRNIWKICYCYYYLNDITIIIVLVMIRIRVSIFIALEKKSRKFKEWGNQVRTHRAYQLTSW